MHLFRFLRSKKIAVLMGGFSREREVSLRSGSKILSSLKKQGFKAYPFDLNQAFYSAVLKKKIDVVFIALHGSPGEDGVVQGFLELLKVPYTGSGPLASALAMDKVASKKIFLAEGIPTPQFFEFDNFNPIEPQIKKALSKIKLPLILKPVAEGSSIGVTIIKDLKNLKNIVEKTKKKFGRIFIEKFIQGKEITVGVIGCGGQLKVLPILELVPKSEFYDYKAKYTPGATRFIIPASLSKKDTKIAKETAKRAFLALGCHGVARIDMIFKDGVSYVHDVNTIPGMTELSDLPAQAKSAGISYDELVLEILKSAFISRT